MKPQQANTAYCKKHAGFVNGLREKRGWQEGDWCDRRLGGLPSLVVELEDGVPHLVETAGRGRGTFFPMGNWDIIWIPTSDDVLGMLDERNTMPALESNVQKDERDLFWIARAGRSKSGWQKTPLIALLELLRAVEGKG